MTPRETLRRALAGVAEERPLVAPRACGLAGEIEGLAPEEFLRNPTKLANLLAQLIRGSRLDVAWVESGSGLTLEAARARDPVGGRVSVALEASRRLHTTLGETAAIGFAWDGPAVLEAAGIEARSGGVALLALIRAAGEAGADLILVDDAGPPPDDARAYVSVLRPALASARFFQALPVLQVPDGWKEVRGALRATAVPCVAPGTAVAGLHALAVDEDAPPAPCFEAASCVLLTTRSELTGRLSLAAARPALDRLRSWVT